MQTGEKDWVPYTLRGQEVHVCAAARVCGLCDRWCEQYVANCELLHRTEIVAHTASGQVAPA